MELAQSIGSTGERTQTGLRVAGSAVFIAVLGLFAVLRFWHLSFYCLDGDEIFSLTVAQADWPVMFSAVLADLVHPPFSYIVLKLWVMIGGDGIVWLRLLPALFSTAAVVPFLLLCRELRVSRIATSLALFLLAVNGYLIYWAHDIRMYSLLLFITLLSYWLFVRFSRKAGVQWNHLLPLLGVNLVLVYTHYFGWFVVGVQFAYLLFFARPKVKYYFSAGCIWAAAFAPWAFAIKLAAAAKAGGFEQNLGWIARPDLTALAWFYAMLNGDIEVHHTTLFGLGLFALPIVLLLVRSERRSNERVNDINERWLLVLAAVLPVVAAFAASRVLPQSVWGERHLIIASVPYFILVADAAFRLGPALLRNTAIAAIVVWAGVAGSYKMAQNVRPAWDKVTAQMLLAEPSSNRQVTLYTLEEVVDPIMAYHLAQGGDTRFHVMNVKAADAVEGDHFWLVLRTPVGKPETETLDGIIQKGYRIGPPFTSETPLEKVSAFPVWKEHLGGI